MPMQYSALFNGCKNDNFQMKNCEIFLILAQNLSEAVLTSTHNQCFEAKIRKNMYTPVNPAPVLLYKSADLLA